MSEPLVYTVAEAAKAMSCSPDTIRRAIRDGALEAHYTTRRPTVLREDLITWWTEAPTSRRVAS